MKKGAQGKGGGAKAAKAKIKDAHVMLNLGLSGRTPLDGDIMSIGLTVFTPADRTIHAVRRWNLLPQHPHPFNNTDVCGYWNSRPEVVDVLMQNRVSAAQAFQDIAAFLAPFGKVTLVGNPLMTLYGFLAQAAAQHAPGVALPWGFSGVCAKSFCSGVLGVPVKDLGRNELYTKWHEGAAMTSLPCHDSALAAVVYCNAAHNVADPSADPVKWLCERPQAPQAVPVGLVDGGGDVAFVPYPKIYDADFVGDEEVRKDVSQALAASGVEDKWLVTEKVHGSNLSVWIDSDGKVRAGKRTGFLHAADGKGFFDFDRLLPRVIEPLRVLRSAILQYTPQFAGVQPDAAGLQVVVFGEIAGGEYGAMPKDIRGRRVQAGVAYAPTNFFYVFDAAFATAEAPDKLHFLPPGVLLPHVPQTESMLPMQLVVPEPCSLEEALEHDGQFQSLIPGRLQLPPLASPNFAEGVVIRPAMNLSMPDGRRAIVKRKHPMFREFQAVGSEALSAIELLFSMINRNRVAAVASKQTAEEVRGDDALAKLVLDDAVADANAMLQRGGGGDSARGVLDGRSIELHREALTQALLAAIQEFREHHRA